MDRVLIEDDPTGPIDHFRWQWGFLSNFHPAKVCYGIHWYATVEHAYQAAKTHDPVEQAQVRHAASPFLAKRMGQKVTVRSDWEQVKRQVMADLLWQKFLLNPEMRAKLLSTGCRELIEGHVGDAYWGVDKYGHGQNHLGKLLMALREVARLVVTGDGRTADKSGPCTARS